MAERVEVTRVDEEHGIPASPLHVVWAYGNSLATIVREECNINKDGLRGTDQNCLRNLLLLKLHQRYKFPPSYDNYNQSGNLVNQIALIKFSRAFYAWKMKLRKCYLCSEFTVVQERYPTITPEDWEDFKNNNAN